MPVVTSVESYHLSHASWVPPVESCPVESCPVESCLVVSCQLSHASWDTPVVMPVESCPVESCQLSHTSRVMAVESWQLNHVISVLNHAISVMSHASWIMPFQSWVMPVESCRFSHESCQLSHASNLDIGLLVIVVTLPGVWCYRVSGMTVWPGVQC